jgi:hypothetical protein
MLKGKQKKLDVNKDGKISGKDFAVLKAEKAKGRGMGLQDEQLPPGKMVKAESGKMVTDEYVKRRKKLGGAGTIFKAESGKMITEAEAPDLGGMMGAQAAPETFDRISEVDTAMAERAVRRKPLPMLKEEQRKPITPKERRERDIAKRAEKKMGGGMIDPTMSNYKKGGSVIAKVKLGRTRPTKLY